MAELLYKNPRRFFSFLLLGSLFLITVAYFMEYVMELKPCILCQLQRVSLVLVAFFSLLGFCHKNFSLGVFKLYLSFILLSILLGVYLSSRQLYLQNLPVELVPNCVPDLNYLLDTLPIFEVILLALQGDGNCAEIVWSLFGISIPGWTLLGFLLLFCYTMVAFLHSKHIHSRF